MKSLAIVGSGIAGLGLAYYLREKYQITIFEKNQHSGGHSNTVLLKEDTRFLPIDTGFMVFNRVTYPALCKLFAELDVPCKKTDMSFSVQEKRNGLEYAGASFDRLFGDRRNIFNLRFWKMLLQLDRFNKEALAALLDTDLSSKTLREFVAERAYGEDFLNFYLIPMSSAVWSSPPEKMLDFPAAVLLRFFHNHGFLGMDTQHQWWTVEGGSREYVSRLLAKLGSSPRLNAGVRGLRRLRSSVEIELEDGSLHSFD
ncbi:MAG: FAD-dependent oxidoreductase, partial [Candidatus Obscuribacterales bacterium]|nr:FAD-dependent oxidoreductase [Candidatus Obscuribacterales bacterium]